MTDAMERFFDRDAPYGPNGYAYGRGEEVIGRRVQTIQFKMRPGDPCLARGVMKMDDGRVYVWTVRSERHADPITGRRRLATLSRRSFEEEARELFAFERDRIEPDLLDEYRRMLDAL